MSFCWGSMEPDNVPCLTSWDASVRLYQGHPLLAWPPHGPGKPSEGVKQAWSTSSSGSSLISATSGVCHSFMFRHSPGDITLHSHKWIVSATPRLASWDAPVRLEMRTPRGCRLCVPHIGQVGNESRQAAKTGAGVDSAQQAASTSSSDLSSIAVTSGVSQSFMFPHSLGHSMLQ